MAEGEKLYLKGRLLGDIVEKASDELYVSVSWWTVCVIKKLIGNERKNKQEARS